MKIPFVERRTTTREKFQSRKYRTVVFWNALAAISIAVQSLLAYKGISVKLPLEIIVSIAGVLNGGYLGVNVLEKKLLPDNTVTTEAKK